MREKCHYPKNCIRGGKPNKPKSCIRETLIKSHRGRCGKKWPRARRLGASIPAVGCKRQANTAPGRLSPQPGGLKPFVDFCGVARSGETAAGIAQRSRLQKSANALQRPSWDLISASLGNRRSRKGELKWLETLQPRLWEEPRKTTEGSPERAPRDPGGFGVNVTRWIRKSLNLNSRRHHQEVC